jgi:glycerophosphoryl diester phosphodiesterase
MVGLQTAEALGVQAIEADVHLFRGRLEVRHLKTLGPIPILWDRWRLANPFCPRLVLAELLAAVDGGTELVLDLKGRDPRLAKEVLEAIAPRLHAGGRTTVCARHWPLLEELEWVRGIRLVHSVGSARQLRRLLRRHRGRRLEGVTIHERLLDSRTVREVHELADVIFTWPVNTLERAQELIRLEVEGLISDRPSLVSSAVGAEN